ncbi:MAG: transposase [Verrucomicrobiae bacterium]|nr:transposase [Verrucomicrobiae bacterium]
MREADSRKSIVEVCQERNISEMTFQSSADGGGGGPGGAVLRACGMSDPGPFPGHLLASEKADVPAAGALTQRLKELSEKHPRYGHRRIAALLRWEGWLAGKRQVHRLCHQPLTRETLEGV